MPNNTDKDFRRLKLIENSSNAISGEDASLTLPGSRLKDYLPTFVIIFFVVLFLWLLVFAILSIPQTAVINNLIQSAKAEEIISFSINGNEVSNTKLISGFLNSYSDWEDFYWSHTQYDEKFSIKMISIEGEVVDFDLYVRHDHQDIIIGYRIKNGDVSVLNLEDRVSNMLYIWYLDLEN